MIKHVLSIRFIQQTVKILDRTLPIIGVGNFRNLYTEERSKQPYPVEK